MTLAEAVQLRRAEYQVHRKRSWRLQDPDEKGLDVSRRCFRCEGSIGVREPARTRMCFLCRALGFVARRCESCDGFLHRRDVCQKRPDFRGYCTRCRETIRKELPGFNDPDWIVSPKRDLSRRQRARGKAK